MCGIELLQLLLDFFKLCNSATYFFIGVNQSFIFHNLVSTDVDFNALDERTDKREREREKNEHHILGETSVNRMRRTPEPTGS